MIRLWEGVFGLVVALGSAALSLLVLLVSLALLLLAPFLTVLFNYEAVRADFRAIRERDPAARGVIERILCYPGFHAILLHRFTHFLHSVLHVPLIPRTMSQVARWFTGVEIHPGAVIGRGVFIDHGMAVVIGETSEVGDNCTIFQGVTLGGTGSQRGKRHPTLEAEVVVGAGARVLGGIRIGRGTRIGAGSVVVSDVPAEATVVGVPGRVVVHRGRRVAVAALDHGNLPDPIREALENLSLRIREAEEIIHREHDFLHAVTICKRREVNAASALAPLEALKKQAAAERAGRLDFSGAIAGAGIKLIGEIKKASPSEGLIRADFDVPALAQALKSGGAAALSVLTDRCYFQGDLAYLRGARAAAGLPVLRKDFVIDGYQVWETAAAGADGVLLITRLLGRERLAELLAEAGEAGLAALVEVHDERDAADALEAGAGIVGVNSRDLATLAVDTDVFFRLAERLPAGVLKVAESGISEPGMVKRLADAGYNAVLVGAFLMKQADVAGAARALLRY